MAAARAIESVDPSNGEKRASLQPHDDAAVNAKLERARAAFGAWSHLEVADRARVLLRAAQILEREKTALGLVMTEEMGKLIDAAEQEVGKCASACRWYAQHAADGLAPQISDDGRDQVRFEPLGAVLAVMPWNFPFWQVIRFAAPALAAGNVGLLKHASNVPRCALALEDLFRRAGAPEGVFQTLLVGSERVAGLIADPRVAAATITGSEAAGREVATAAGRAIKKMVLELGGSDPFIVLASADLDAAVATAVKARVVNSGQSCIAAKRFIAVDAVYDRFAPRFVEAMKALVVGDPRDRQTQVGPLATPAIAAALAEQVERSVAAGAKLLAGGRRRPGAGNYFEPTVLADVPPAAPAYFEELFGPVASLFRVKDAAAAIALANATRFGLGASVWTRDRAEATFVAREIEAGMVFVNGMVASEPALPFGGVKSSGYGRELGTCGLREFVNIKTVRLFDL